MASIRRYLIHCLLWLLYRSRSYCRRDQLFLALARKNSGMQLPTHADAADAAIASHLGRFTMIRQRGLVCLSAQPCTCNVSMLTVLSLLSTETDIGG